MKYLFVITTIFLITSCVNQQVSEPAVGVSSKSTPRPPVSPTATPTPAPEKIDSRLQKHLGEIAKVAKGRVGVGAILLETGDTAFLDRHGHYPMQSVYKLPIAMAVLKMVDEGKVRIDQEVSITPKDFVRQGFHSPIRNANPDGIVMPLAEIIRFSISESDGTASDVLLDMAGGAEAVMAYLGGIGINDMIVADSEKSISKDWETQYRNWSTPEASINLLAALNERRARLSEPMTDFLLNIMTASETGERRIKRGLPEGASLAHKTGTGGSEDRIASATNDIGIVTLPDGRHILIAVYVSDSPEPAVVRQKVMADIAHALVEKWAPGSYPEESEKASEKRNVLNSKP